MTSISAAVNSPTKFVTVNERRLAYRSIGSGEPVVLCQRFRGTLDDWDPAFLDALAGKFTVIIFDYTGIAASAGTPHSTIAAFANDVKDLALALQLDKFIIGGWSFGGAVAQTFAMQFPELISQMILLGTGAPGKMNHPPASIFLQTSAKPVNDFEDFVILFFEPASELSRAAAKASYERMAARTIDKEIVLPPEIFQYYHKAFADYIADPYGARQLLFNSKIPMLVISSDHEVAFPVENWFELNGQLPFMQLIVLPQGGHGPQHQYPELVAGYIKQFVESEDRRQKTEDLCQN
jgi:pimeloyl-ACP methyl ester carboxylesterase